MAANTLTAKQKKTSKLELNKNQHNPNALAVALKVATHMNSGIEACIKDEHLKQLGVFVGGYGRKGNVLVTAAFYQPFKENGSLLVSRLMKAIVSGVGSLPTTFQISDLIKGFSWNDIDERSVLEDFSGGQRNKGPCYMNFMDAQVSWPPPLEYPTVSVGASIAWEATVPGDEYLKVDLEDFCAQVKGSTAVMFRCYFANGKSSLVWIIRAMDVDIDSCKDLVTQTNGKETHWKMVRRCVFCMRGPPFADYHDHTQCLLVGTMNKAREQGGYSLIKIDNGILNVTLVKSQTDLEKKIKMLESRMGELEKRVIKLEPKTAKKRAASDPKPAPAKKAKTSTSSSLTAKGKKKAN